MGLWILLPSLWKRMSLEWVEWLWAKLRVTWMIMNVICTCNSRKRQQYLKFPYSPTVDEIYDLIACRWLMSTENWTTNSFCVHHYKGCKSPPYMPKSQPGNTMQQWVQSVQHVTTHCKLIGWYFSALWFALFHPIIKATFCGFTNLGWGCGGG